jgi:outer membrane protein assembly factor BamD (BamD/ComL family)
MPPALTFLFVFVLTAFSIPTSGFSQISEDEVLKMLAQYDLQTARQKIEEIYRQRPSSAPAAYWRALMTEEAEEATELFDEVVLRFRNSEYAARAMYRIAQYHFAQGQYHSAKKYFSDLCQRFPKSSLFSAARYFAAKSWMAAGVADSAYSELHACVETYPNTWISKLAKEDLDHFSPDELQMAQIDGTKFTVQVGAFTKRENALKHAKKFKAMNYPVEVFSRQYRDALHLVWVGEFTTREEAVKFGDVLRKKVGGQIQIVLREP